VTSSPPRSSELYLDEDRFELLWTALEELRVPLYLHPQLPARAVQEATYRGHRELVGAAWGFAPETAIHVLGLVHGGVFDRHPEANLILGHQRALHQRHHGAPGSRYRCARHLGKRRRTRAAVARV
jgi:2,3-dihydroxybenzoate decarboxylase